MRYLGKKHLLSVATVASALALATACSSSSTGGGGDSNSSAPPATTSTDGGGGGSSSSGGGATGSTITIGGTGAISSSVLSQPERKAAEEAAIDAINAAGGVNGHPLKLDWCDTKNDANGEFTCMRQLTDDKVTAIVAPGLIVDQSSRGLKYAASKGIPIIGGQGLSPAEFSTPGVFPLSGGIPGWSYGQVAELVKEGAKKIALFGDNEAGSLYILSFTQSAMQLAGIKPVRYVKTDQNADPTFSQGAAKAIAGDVDAVIFDSSPTYGAKAVQALRGAGFKGPIASITGVFTAPIIKSLGANAENLYLTSQTALSTDTSNPGVQAFLAGMKKIAPNDDANETAMTAWTATQLFAKVAATVQGGITAKSVLDAMDNLSTPIDLQTAGPYQVKGVTSPLKDYPQMYNTQVALGVVKSGALVPFGDGGFVDPFKTLAAVKGS
jgi:ABC-type branched-subunit amino acid transport system substrate-binding protein